MKPATFIHHKLIHVQIHTHAESLSTAHSHRAHPEIASYRNMHQLFMSILL